jgi:L-lactate dehydrogenase complex protein LldG
MSSAREDILKRVRLALGPSHAAPPPVPREYRQAGEMKTDVVLFCERVSDYGASVHRIVTAQLDPTLRALCGSRTGIPAGFRFADGIVDAQLELATLDSLDTALTGCRLAIAETGTIILDGRGRSGRRALSLVPDHHVCVVEARDVVASLPDAIARLHGSSPLTFVSGPSATADIELRRVQGVHGPRRLDVVVVDAV